MHGKCSGATDKLIALALDVTCDMRVIISVLVVMCFLKFLNCFITGILGLVRLYPVYTEV
jgi:phosphoribosyl-AMP cyclohydrolase